MSLKDSIRKNFSQVKSFQKAILEELSQFEYDSRENLIREDYIHELTENNSWLQLYSLGPILEENPNLSQPKIDFLVKISKTLKKIKENPQNKKNILLQYLSDFEAISETDKEVLLENFISLSEEELKEELNNICEIFGE